MKLDLSLSKVLLEFEAPSVVRRYTEKDTILYALGVGLGSDPVDPVQLKFTYEDGLHALPTMPAILGGGMSWLQDPQWGIDWSMILHGEQDVINHRPLPPSGSVIGTSRVVEIIDKGPKTGAILYLTRELRDEESGELIATLNMSLIARGNGGFCGKEGPTPPVQPIPEGRAPDIVFDQSTLPQAALIYRLSGDYNPLHASPEFARKAGFDRPILHGLCSFGVVGYAIMCACCDGDPAKLKRIKVRFAKPVWPGETIRTEIWRDGNDIAFRAKVVERDVVVLNNGLAEIG